MSRQFLSFAVISALLCVFSSTAALASSHREAPFIAGMPKVDGTDFYMFRSYEQNRDGFVTLIANYLPLQDPYGGPNYYTLDPHALYEINIDNNGDSVEDITFQFRFQTVYRNASVPTVTDSADTNIPIPLVNIGPRDPADADNVGTSADPVGPGLSDNKGLNVVENYQVSVVRNGRRSEAQPTYATNPNPLNNDPGNGTFFRKPVDNIGDKTFGGPGKYKTYANNHIVDIDLSQAIPGCTTPGRVFVGQRKEGFVVNLGQLFDRVNLDPFGARNAAPNQLANKNVTSLALEVPISCLTADGKGVTGTDKTADPVIGGWTTASLRQARVLNPLPALPIRQDGEINTPAVEGGPWTQVSRLGSPLVNEVVISLNSKDRFNASSPANDLRDTGFATFITNPSLPVLLNALFPSAIVPAVPRIDLLSTFATGLTLSDTNDNVLFTNRPVDLTRGGEMLRLNTSIAPKPLADQNDLGLLACDTSGFPNGRRPYDDVVDIALNVVEGAILPDDPDTTDENEANPNALQTCDVSSGTPTVVPGAVVTDGAEPQRADYDSTFPYLQTPLSGASNNATP